MERVTAETRRRRGISKLLSASPRLCGYKKNSLSFVKQKNIDPFQVEQLLEENKDNELLRMIVQAIQKADALQKNMNLANYSFTGITLTLGLPPDVSIRFNRIKEQSIPPLVYFFFFI